MPALTLSPLSTGPPARSRRSFGLGRLGATCVAVLVATSLLLSLAWPARSGVQRMLLDTHSDVSGVDGALAPWFSFEGEKGADGRHAIQAHNARALRGMLGCMQAGTCAPNQDKVVLVEEHHLRSVVAGTNWIGGEMIWANSTIRALDTLGYTYIFVEQFSAAVLYYNLFPTLVVALLADYDWLAACWEDQHACAKSAYNPGGIPIWKMLSYYFWADEVTPLDGRWVLAPEPWPQRPGTQHINTYLGYSIDERCTQHAFVPPAARPPRAYVLSKFLSYLVEAPGKDAPAWPPRTWRALVDMGVAPVVSLKVTQAADGAELAVPDGLAQLPPLGPDEFVTQLGKSRVLIGVGNPATSPTPYEALCMGVPFINPIMDWDEANPDDKSKWSCQHDSLCRLGPGAPYVYNVRRGDGAGLLAAIRSALDTPIERHVVERMKQNSVVRRLDAILRRDLEGMARELLERRHAGLAPGELFAL